MSARTAGHVLLALALLGAAGVVALGVVSGSVDRLLLVLAAGGVLAAVLLVRGDARRRGVETPLGDGRPPA